MELRVTERVGRIRWIFLPLGLCALVAVGAHAAADVVGDRVLWCVDRVDAFFDAIFSSWQLTAPLVDAVGLTQRTFLARAVALAWELAADALIAVPLLGYEERAAQQELLLAQTILRRRQRPLRFVRPAATLLVAIAGACAVARMVQGSVQLALHVGWISRGLFVVALLALLGFLVPRAVFRSLQHAAAARGVAPAALIVLAPLMLAALLSWAR